MFISNTISQEKIDILLSCIIWRAVVRVASQCELTKTLASLRVHEFESGSKPSLAWMRKGRKKRRKKVK